MKKQKRWASALLAAAMVTSLAGCAGQVSSSSTAESAASAELTDPTAQSYTGTVSAISADSITLSTDENGDVTLTMNDSTTFTRSGMPDGQSGEDASTDAAGGVPEKPADDAAGDTAGDPPAKPDGDSQTGNGAPEGTPPAQPSGDGADQDGNAPAQPSGDGAGQDGTAPAQPGSDGADQDGTAPQDGTPETLTWESVSVGDTVTVTLGTDGTVQTVALAGPDGQGAPGGQGGPGGGSSQPESYTAAATFTSDTTTDGETYASTGTDENAVLVQNGASVTLNDATITRNSADSTGGDNSSFYGVGAAALVTDGTLTLDGATIATDAKGGAGVFAYGDGTAYVSDSTITTAQDTSGGIHVAGGGTLYARDLTVTTEGGSSAAIRSDRGSGTMVVDGGSYTSNGSGSPAVYSTADITVHNAALTANGSEAICIEGLNTIRLFDCDLTGSMADNEQNDCTWNVILYQSMSGDSAVGNSTFEMVGGSLTAKNGGMFYTTNTESTFLLSGVDITYADDNDFFLKCTGNANARGWGQTGANGADCTFTARAQQMQGDVIWDSISQLDLYVLDGSTLTGAVLDDETNAGSGGSGYASLYISSNSTWVVTGDSTLTNLYCAGTLVDSQGRAVTVQGTDGTVYVQGSSDVTVTVSSYSTSVDTSGAATTDSWSDYAVNW